MISVYWIQMQSGC